jgi:hypothetical protein
MSRSGTKIALLLAGLTLGGPIQADSNSELAVSTTRNQELCDYAV